LNRFLSNGGSSRQEVLVTAQGEMQLGIGVNGAESVYQPVSYILLPVKAFGDSRNGGEEEEAAH
jgi:hypothetical protein